MGRNASEYAEGQGLYILSFFESAGEVSPVFERKARKIFEEHGLEDVAEDEFYPAPKIADAFFEVVEEVGEMTMQQGGRQMGRDVPWPAGVGAPHDGLETIDEIHQAAARPSEDAPSEIERPGGGYTYERTGEASARVGITAKYPYPAIMAEGVFLGIVDGLGGTSVTIQDTAPTGNEQSAWEIEWD